MLIGVPKEIKNHEYRIGLTPAGARELVNNGHKVMVQKDGGKADGPTLAKALESFRNEPLLVGPTTYTTSCHIAVGRKMAMIQIQNGKPSFLSNVTPKKVPKAPC